MITEMKTRPYKKKRRAEQQARTRDRIVEATMALHEELGPRAASVSAIAERAGVQRLTVYRHFPDDASLFAACTSRWIAAHPPPDPADWAAVADPAERVRTALQRLYRYYRGTARMWALSYRDRDEVPALQAPMAAFEAQLDAIGDDLLCALAPEAGARGTVAATLRHALQFSTWASLDREGLDDGAMAALVVRWLEGLGVPAAAPLTEKAAGGKA